ncbi:MAG: SGNH/GDSL hydrolase family protein [Gammaproteobacteria bacterium]|nr:SGNH/GDSL hydrolase family protein [Gammaproteobacteria bacterium]MBU1978059.1 SGNH/GDSL hydrolase family protein [Gammaproteobacteria bacterium]
MSFLTVIVILVVIEAGLVAIVSLQRRNFPWLITKQDELPTLDPQALEKFLDYSFDPHLGWVRKPDSSGIENGQKGPVTFHIDALGSRANPFNKTPPAMAVFGDSYAFCRQVEDGETWEVRLAQQQEFGVLNFGVGNYGVDQALLRYEGLKLSETVKIVVMAFVPETICRIQSYWKHYLEFGNTFAFKPRFALSPEGKLVLLENKIRNAEDFAALREKLPEIRKHDGFYEKKFRSHQFRFPYLLSLLRNPPRQIMLICAIAVRSVLRALGVSNRRMENLPFALIMKRNLIDAYRLYRDSESTKLLSAILLRFRQEAQHRGHSPLIVVMPQLLDLKLNRNKAVPYQNYFAELAQQMPVLDLTDKFADAGFEKLYIDDQYGGHLSAEGNLQVAEAISAWLASGQNP